MFQGYNFPAGFFRTTSSIAPTGIHASQPKVWATDTADFIAVKTTKAF